MSVMFQNVPGSGLIAPIFAFEVTSGGLYESLSRLLLIGHKTVAGTLADNVPTICTSLEEATQLAGSGSMLREMFRIARANAPAQEIWIMAAPATGVAATWTVTVVSVPAAGGVGTIQIGGETITVTAAAGDTVTTVAAALVSAINGYFNALTGAQLQVTATNTAGVVTVTARHAGLVLADYDIFVPTTVAGNIFAGAAMTVANGTAGTGSPDLTAALAALGDTAFDWIVSPFSDATNIGRYTTLMSDVSGRWAWSRQAFGHIFTVATDTTANLTTLGLGLNDRHLTIIPRFASGGNFRPGYLWAAAIAARIAPWLSDDSTGNAARNQTNLVIEGLTAPRDPTRWPIYATRNALLASGISTWSVTSDGRVAVDKIITTSRLGAAGQPDVTFRDIQTIAITMHVVRILRFYALNEHGQKAIADENPDDIGAISTPADIRATLIHAYEDCRRRGLVEDVAWFASNVVVERAVGQPNRVNVLAPVDVVNPLDVFAANTRIYAQAA